MRYAKFKNICIPCLCLHICIKLLNQQETVEMLKYMFLIITCLTSIALFRARAAWLLGRTLRGSATVRPLSARVARAQIYAGLGKLPLQCFKESVSIL